MGISIGNIQNDDFLKAYGEIVKRTFIDADFKARFLADPAGVLAEAGIDIPSDVEIKVELSTAGSLEGHEVITLPLPDAPEGTTSEALLAEVNAGSSCAACAGTASCPACTSSTAGSGC
jgi:hypothetical protein